MTRTEKLLAALIALPSVNPAFAPAGRVSSRSPQRYGEQTVAEFLATIAARAGLEIEFQTVFKGRGPAQAQNGGNQPPASEARRSNLIVRLRPAGKIRRTILLAPHLDTVGAAEAQFIPRQKNGRLHGRGACDTKGSVAAMLTALCELAESKSRPGGTQIVFAGLVDEENAQAGSRALAASGFRADLAIVGEPTRLEIVTAHKGSLWLQLATHGRAAHGAKPHLGKNAVHEMSRIVDILETKYAAQLGRRRHRLLGPATVNVGTIAGGTQPNIVPDRCAISIDRRTLPGETENSVRREIAGLLKSEKLSAQFSCARFAPALPLETNPRLPLVQALMRSAGQSKPAGVDYFCDAAVLSAAGIPSVVFGPGDIAQAHTTNEWISLAELERGKGLLLKFLKSLS